MVFITEGSPSVSQDLLLKYDSKFNKTLNKMNNMNNEITTKNKMIHQIHNADMMKHRKTQTLLLVLAGLAIITVLLVLYLTKVIPGLFFIIASILVIVFLFMRGYFKYYANAVVDFTSQTASTAQDFIDNIDSAMAEAASSSYSCPATCSNVETSESTTSETDLNYVNIEARPTYLRTDSNRNVWLKGDLPNSTYTINDNKKTYRIDGTYVTGFGYDKQVYQSPSNLQSFRTTLSELEKNRPQRKIIPIDKKQGTYYNCSFIGSEYHSEMNPNKVPYKTRYKYTTIPCSYYPGFKEDDRLICNSDPRSNSDAQCKKIV